MEIAGATNNVDATAIRAHVIPNTKKHTKTRKRTDENNSSQAFATACNVKKNLMSGMLSREEGRWRRALRGQCQDAPENGAFTPDAELVHAARGGDKRAFVEIVARHQAMVCGIALGILGD